MTKTEMTIHINSELHRAEVIAKIETAMTLAFNKVHERNVTAMIRAGCTQMNIDFAKEANEALLSQAIQQAVDAIYGLQVIEGGKEQQ